MSWLVGIFVILFACQVNSQYNDSELLSVVVLFRHGDRAPTFIYKNDPNGDSYWENGLGQLTNLGKRQHYNLGYWFRERYSDFIPSQYRPGFLQVHSSNVDRCLMSATSHLAGFYTPEDGQIWNKNLLWQPIPIFSTAKNRDPIVAQDYYCKKYYDAYYELMETKDFKELFEQYQPLFEYVSENSGENITSLSDLSYLFNTLYIEKKYNLIIPDWVDQVYPELEKISNWSWTTYTYNDNLARLYTGPLINFIAENFEGQLNNVTDTPKYLILSGHDTTIATFLNSLGLFDLLWPEYASSVILELRKGQQTDPFLNMYYKNDTDIKNLTLEGCDFDCDFAKFQEIIKPIRVEDLEAWKAECEE